jgi:hypothetical protein
MTDVPRHLAADQAAVFRGLAEALASKNADSLYDAIPSARNGLVISADVARWLAPEFATWDGRLRHTPSTSRPAGEYAHQRMLREIATPKGRTRLMITAGCAGSGKTSLLAANYQSADLVFDNQFKDLPRAREILTAAIDHKWEVTVTYVHRPWRDLLRAVIERSQRTGRWNALAEMPDMAVDAQGTLLALHSEFKGSVDFRAVYNATDGFGRQPKNSEIRLEMFRAQGVYHQSNAKELAQIIPEVARRAIKARLACKEVIELIFPSQRSHEKPR